MARSYRKVNQATDSVRRALGALAAASEQEPMKMALAMGYVRATLEAALEHLAAAGGMQDSTAFVDGYSDISAYLEPIPFPES